MVLPACLVSFPVAAAVDDYNEIFDTRESREWFRAYARDVLRERFRQTAIYLKFVGPVEHLVVTEEEISDED